MAINMRKDNKKSLTYDISWSSKLLKELFHHLSALFKIVSCK